MRNLETFFDIAWIIRSAFQPSLGKSKKLGKEEGIKVWTDTRRSLIDAKTALDWGLVNEVVPYLRKKGCGLRSPLPIGE